MYMIFFPWDSYEETRYPWEFPCAEMSSVGLHVLNMDPI